ncbi:hypothetical protein Mal64_25550 [Pseudobythopirellula maris]|uniref:J domain-containing protein n=1 Tax=Pseudobythopirellula maris TaxID=2527991 RepID=A0A5C5ZS41_9BACT|nr:hypothetical protein [Pseudobythopirellula maris]TWT89063.1 hypothetical protein Mal64_25550 [Pseudobythopirellula maris]
MLPDPTESSRLRKETPEALKKLELSLPVTEADVKQAYFAKAREAHPDHGGGTAEFIELQRAFDEAIEIAKRSGKRLPWLSAQMPTYIAQEAAMELVAEWGGKSEVVTIDWLEDTVGDDFAALGDRLIEIDLTGLPIGDAELRRLAEEAPTMPFLKTLRLANTRVSDDGLRRLPRLGALQVLDLRGTRVSYALRKQLAKQPGMERVEGASRFAEWLHGR